MAIIGGMLYVNPYFVSPDDLLRELHERDEPDEVERLRRAVRDLVALSALPAVWSGREPAQIAESLADAISGVLRPDLVYVRLQVSSDGEMVEAVRAPGRADKVVSARAVGEALTPALGSQPPMSPVTIVDPLGEGHLRVLAVPINHIGEYGVFCVCSRRAGFPTELDHLLCTVACNQAAVAIRAKRDEEALRRLRDHLEIQVEERTARLTQVNHTLRAEVTERKRAELKLKDSLDQLHTLASHLQSIREEERARVAREVHDELGQSLTALKMNLASLRRSVKKGAHAIPADGLLGKMDSMAELIDATITTVQRIATELHPPVLDTLGLVAALEWQAQDFQERTGIACQFVSNVEDVSLEPERMMAIFRIFQESLTNVWRHARATRVRARLNERNGVLTLTVQDNGIGIDETHHTEARSFGLLGMRERALLLGGAVRVAGAPNRGTKVTLRIPMRQ